MYLLMKESSSQIEHDFRVARSLVRRPPKQGFGQPLANMMSLLSTIKFRRLDLPMLKKSLMHDEWCGLWYCGIVDLWTCGLFVFWQKVDRNKVSRRWCQLASRMHNVFTFVSKQQLC